MTVRLAFDDSSGDIAARAPFWRSRRWHRILITTAVLFVLFCVATAHLLIWPDRGMPPKVDAIVMLDGPGHPLDVALHLAGQHRAAFLVVSQGRPIAHDPCPPTPPGVTLICFHPRPATTQGEAEFVGRVADRYHWRSIAVVATTPQASRARLRLTRCFAGRVYVITKPIRLGRWPYEIAYEWGALVKAAVIQRGC